MAKLKPWYQVVTPREDLRENRPLEASEFAVHLDHIRTGRETVSKDYADPARFFERTYRFGLSPNLNQVLVSHLGGVQDKSIDERIRKRTEELFRKNSNDACKFIEREFFPKRSNDVKEVPRITLVVMALEHPAEERSTRDLMETIVRDIGTSGRTFKSALLFTAADPGENIRDKAREVLAWEDIEDDEETKKRIDEGQLYLLKRNLKNAQRDLDEAIFRAYKHLYLLDKQNKLRHIDLGNITSSSAGSLVEVYLQRLGSSGGLDEIVESVPARKLAGFWPASMSEWSTKAVRDAFYASPLLPRLLSADQVKRAIADGVREGLVGYAVRDSSGQLRLQKLKDSLFENEVEISEGVYILKPDDAQRLREPPRLAALIIRPEHVVVRVGEQASFSCSGTDQYGQPFSVAGIEWSATGGTIDQVGLFTAGQTGGAFVVKGFAAGSEAVAEVRVTTKEEKPDPALATGDRHLRWRGVIPAQKWINFYTKVLSKFATSSDLKLEISFEVKVDREQAESKLGETKSALRELGLDDNVTL